MAAVQFACVVKTGPLHEHSPMLNDISQVPRRRRAACRKLSCAYFVEQVATWAKLNGGMIKMFEAEVSRRHFRRPYWHVHAHAVNQVLLKFPVIQHFLFGKLLPAPQHTPK
jgi:serine/threonine-protein phosphatase 2A activator